MATETTAAEARNAWLARLGALSDHKQQHACQSLPCETVRCDERVRLKQAERESWWVYFEIRVAEGGSDDH